MRTEHGAGMHLLQQVGQIKGGLNNAKNMDFFYNCDAGIGEWTITNEKLLAWCNNVGRVVLPEEGADEGRGNILNK